MCLGFIDLLDPEVVSCKLGVVDAEVDTSVDTGGILDLQSNKRSNENRSVKDANRNRKVGFYVFDACGCTTCINMCE